MMIHYRSVHTMELLFFLEQKDSEFQTWNASNLL